jgi:hypothetical protein
MTEEERLLALKRRITYTLVISLICVGAIMALALHSLFTDLLGKEKYMRWVEDHWVSSSITIPFALIILVVLFAAVRAFTRVFIKAVS